LNARRSAACIALCAGAPAAQAAGTITFCSDGSPDGFDITQYETVTTNDTILPMLEQLLAMTPGTTDVVPGLAERWQVSADGLQYTFTLRAGVKFHSAPWFKPTRDLNADDVLWSFNRLNDPKHPARAAARGGFPYWAGMGMPELLKAVDKQGERTVRFTLARPEAAFIANMTMSSIATIYSAEYGEQLQRAGKPEALNTQPIGTGPYAFKSYQKDAVIRYTAHPGYWRGKPKLDGLIFAVTPDPSVRVQRLKAGECQVAPIVTSDAAAFDGDKRIEVRPNKPLFMRDIAANVQRRFTSDRRFRQALSLAIDREALVNVVWAGRAMVATSYLPPGIWSHDASLVNRQDVAQARQLVKESGYDGSELVLFAPAQNGQIKRAVELMQADWARVGINVKPRLMEKGELYKRTGQGKHDLALVGWLSDNGDPDNFFTPNLSCAAVQGSGNKSRWCDATFDKLLADARAAPDVKARTPLYREAQKLLHREMPAIVLVYPQELTAVHQRVKGFVATPFGGHDFNNASID
jgi:dipeptide transport system substrate-binding protein